MKIRSVTALPTTFKVPEGKSVTLGIGRSVKRDTVLVKVETDEGLVGWGEAHPGRCAGAIAKLIDTTISQLVVGMDPLDVAGVWKRVYRMQIASHGMGTAAALALSGLDIALWDIRGKAAGWPLYRLLGGTSKPVPAYAGGIALGWQPPESLAEEACSYVERGYRALKLRLGDGVPRDIARMRAVRAAVGDGIDILTDANTSYTVDDVRRVMPVLAELNIGWLEEPFGPQEYRAYQAASKFATVPLAAGENHYTRYDFARLLDDGAVHIAQPDLSKAGGITETMRIAALTSAYKIPVHPHTSGTAINMVASIHLLCALENGGYFESDVAAYHPFRDDVAGKPDTLDADGCVRPPDGPGLGIEIDMEFLTKHPLVEGPGYI